MNSQNARKKALLRWAGKCIWVIFFNFILWVSQSRSKPLIVFKILKMADNPNITRWFLMDFKIFVKTSKPFDHQNLKLCGALLLNLKCSVSSYGKKWLWGQNWVDHEITTKVFQPLLFHNAKMGFFCIMIFPILLFIWLLKSWSKTWIISGRPNTSRSSNLNR